MTQQKPPVLIIKMVPAGVEIVISALRESNLPHSQVAPLLAEIAGQAQYQLNELTKAEMAKLEKAAEKAKQPRKKRTFVKREDLPTDTTDKTPAEDPDPSDVLA